MNLPKMALCGVIMITGLPWSTASAAPHEIKAATRVFKSFDRNPATTHEKTVTLGDRTYTPLPAAPDMPYVPAYSGQKKFFRGRKIVNNKNGNVGLESIYFCKEDRNAVLDWYKAGLKQMKWDVEDTGSKDAVACSRVKEGYHLTIQALKGPDVEYRSQIVVNLSILKPPADDDDSEKPEPADARKNPNVNPQPGINVPR